MAQGQFTKQEADQTKSAIEELFDALPKSKRMGFIGHLNDILLFLNAAKSKAPDESEVKDAQTGKAH
jgi:hypothetical protein